MRVVISCVAGTFFLSDGKERSKIPVEHCSSKEALSDWAETHYENVFYNFPDSALPEKEGAGNQDSLAPSVDVMDEAAGLARKEAGRILNNSVISREIFRSKEQEKAVLETSNCLQCKKDFTRPAYLKSQRFCSKPCVGSYKSENYFKEHPEQAPKEYSCTHCKEKFFRRYPPCELKKKKNFFCTRKCSHLFQKKPGKNEPLTHHKLTKECSFCHKDFEKKFSNAELEGTSFYCSSSCNYLANSKPKESFQ